MFRGALTAVGVAALVAVAGFAGAVGPAATNAQQADGPTIDVAASGQAQADPDRAILRVAVVATGDDANAVRERLGANASRLRAALAENGVPDDRVRTVAYTVDRRYDRETTTDRPRGFEGVHAFEVTLANVSRAGEIVDVAVANGADRVDSVELTLSPDRRRAVRADALRDAMANARSDAEVLAESAGLSIAGVHTVSTGDASVQPFRTEAFDADAGGEAATDIDAGPVTVSAQVAVTYNGTDA
ncbi:SIMPL domain-containing protein [Halorussus marinus]|uniref:SIMPL domain-containing protein n=1 Tax=Halorussus marinus TaxID=2505976 RepID=UPI001092B69D|nr:SIMPL domain-containing protein [Halorussus marinus]